MIPIEGHPNLFRDEKSGAIVNCDTLEYESYLRMKKKKIDEQQELQNLKLEVSEIKNLLMELINETRRDKT